MERRSTPSRHIHRNMVAYRSKRDIAASSRDDDYKCRLPSRDRDADPRAEEHVRRLPSQDRDVRLRAEERGRRGTSRDSDISSRDEQLGLHPHGRGGGNLRGRRGRPYRGNRINYRGVRRYPSSRGRGSMNQRGSWGHVPSRCNSSHSPTRSSSNHAPIRRIDRHLLDRGSKVTYSVYEHLPIYTNGFINRMGSRPYGHIRGRGGMAKSQLIYNHHHDLASQKYSNTRRSQSPARHYTVTQQEEERQPRIPPQTPHKLQATMSGQALLYPQKRSRSPSHERRNHSKTNKVDVDQQNRNFNKRERGVSRSRTESSPNLYGLLTQEVVPTRCQIPITDRKHVESYTRHVSKPYLETYTGNTPAYSQSGSQTASTPFNMPLTPRTPFDAHYVPKTPQNPYYMHRTPSTPGDKDWTPSTPITSRYVPFTPGTPSKTYPLQYNDQIDDSGATDNPNKFCDSLQVFAMPSTSKGASSTYALGGIQRTQPSASEGALRRQTTTENSGCFPDANLNAVRDSVALEIAEENGTTETDFTDITTVSFTSMESLTMLSPANPTVGDSHPLKISNQPTSPHSINKPFCKELDSDYPLPPLPSRDEILNMVEYQVPYDCKMARMRYVSRFSGEVPQPKKFKRIPLTMSDPQIKSRYSNLVRNQGLAAVKDILTIDEEEMKRGINFSEVAERNKYINLRQGLHLQCLERYGSDRMMKLMVHVDTHVCVE